MAQVPELRRATRQRAVRRARAAVAVHPSHVEPPMCARHWPLPGGLAQSLCGKTARDHSAPPRAAPPVMGNPLTCTVSCSRQLPTVRAHARLPGSAATRPPRFQCMAILAARPNASAHPHWLARQSRGVPGVRAPFARRFPLRLKEVAWRRSHPRRHHRPSGNMTPARARSMPRRAHHVQIPMRPASLCRRLPMLRTFACTKSCSMGRISPRALRPIRTPQTPCTPPIPTTALARHAAAAGRVAAAALARLS
jgi:hypothetical protein